MPDENELYQAWRDAGPEDREELTRQLFASVQRHARAVIWIRLDEIDDHVIEDLAQEVAIAALREGRFKERSRFSTWVQAIAYRKCWQELRSRTRRRAVFDDWPEPEDEDEDPNLPIKGPSENLRGPTPK